MNLLSMYKPSMDRIYANKDAELRSSFQSILMVLASFEELIQTGSQDARESQLNMLVGCTNRHFDLQARKMIEKGYDPDSMDIHLTHHSEFVQTVEMYSFNFNHATVQQNLCGFRAIQKWLLHHLLMDDAHFMSKCY